MDDRRFDALARALGGAATRRSALGALAGLLAGGAMFGAGAKKNREQADSPHSAGKRRNRKRCNPECTGNFSCVKGVCVCEQALCGGACCDVGQTCQRGRCVGQGTVFCHDLGETCGDGAPCCAGLQCGSGYGGGPVACWPVPGGECVANEECAYGQHCENGACVYDPPPPSPTPAPTPPPAPRCDPTFEPTADASANGKALQDAVAAATTGDTIVLAPGDYQFDEVGGQFVSQVFYSLAVTDKRLTIERCSADAVVTLICPVTRPTGATGNWICVGAETAAASLTLRGLSVEARNLVDGSAAGYAILVWGASVVLEDVAVKVAGYNWTGILVQGSASTVTIRSGVSVDSADLNTIRKGLWPAGGSVTCDAAMAFEGGFAANRCVTSVAGCGCTP